MEVAVYWLTLGVTVAVIVTSGAMSIPHVDDINNNQLSGSDGKELGERATWLDTRDLQENFVDMVELAINQLASEGRINPVVMAREEEGNSVTKRGRFQGFCFRKTNTGRFLPYVCWKQDKRRR